MNQIVFFKTILLRNNQYYIIMYYEVANDKNKVRNILELVRV